MEYIGAVFGGDITRAVISNPAKKSAEIKKAVITLKSIGGAEKYQIETFTEKQAFHKNVEKTDIAAEAERIMTEGGFRQLDAWSESAYYLLKVSKKGKTSLTKNGSPITRSLSAPRAITAKRNIFWAEAGRSRRWSIWEL